MKNRKNLKTIAEKLGLNVATVSRAIRPSTQDLVKPSTRKKILDLMKKEGYRPNIQARNLKKQAQSVISMILPVGIDSIFYDQYYQNIIQGINEVLVDTEYALSVLPVRADFTTDDMFRMLIDNDTAALVLSPYCRYIEFPLDLIKKYGYPVASIDNEIEGNTVYNITLDHYGAGRLGAEIMEAKGRKDIILVSDEGRSKHSELRRKGFNDHFKKNGAGLKITNIEAPFSRVSGVPVLEEIKARFKSPVSVFVLNDEIAVNMLINANKFGLSCPDDISVLGFDGLNIGEFLDPQLQSVAFPFKTVGKFTADTLIKVLSGKKTAKRIGIEARLTEGASV